MFGVLCGETHAFSRFHEGDQKSRRFLGGCQSSAAAVKEKRKFHPKVQKVKRGEVIFPGKAEVISMKSPLHILHLEDDPDDAALIQSTLEAGGITCAITRVQNHDDFVAALEHGGIDLIIADFSLPAFDGLSAAETVRDKWPAIPLILVSVTLDEELIIESIKSGATDYVVKQRLCRLAPVVRRAMKDVEEGARNRLTEETLRDTEQRFHILFNESDMGIAMVGADGCPILTNPALQKMLGYTGEELCRMPFQDFTHPEDRAPNLELYRQLFKGAHKSYQIEKRFIRKDGQVVRVHLSVSMARGVLGHSDYALGMAENITERRNLEAKFIEAQKMEVVGQLAGGVAHDFNNVLAVIMGYSDLTMDRLEPDNALKSNLETIRSVAERAAGLTRQLLVFSRKQVVLPVVLDINDVVKDLDKMLRLLIDENIEMTIVPGKQTGRINADSGYVGQVLMNLVVNARDAMPNGGKLTITTNNVTLDENYARTHTGAIPGNYVMLSVRDTGTGMTEEVKAHLFEAFFTTKPKGKGTGLGLATCQTIIQQAGGHIDLYSEVGKGTIFKVYFPRVEQPLDVADRRQTGPLPRGTETLLIVEDEPTVRHLARDVLEAQGYEVIRASNGQHALHVAREHKGSPIRLVITDVIMPLMDGNVMAEWLKSTYPDLKILFTSGYMDDTIANHGVLEAGINFVAKPYTPAILTRKVRELLDSAPETAHL
jgi:PAS domain S-box-containing protein